LDDVVEFLAWSDDVEACADDTNDPDGDDVGTDAGGLAFCLTAAAVTSVLAGLLGAAAAKGMTLATDDFFTPLPPTVLPPTPAQELLSVALEPPVTVHNDEDRSDDAANEAAARRGLGGAGFGLWFEGGKGASAP